MSADSTQTPAPDYGEPWATKPWLIDCQIIKDRIEETVCDDDRKARAVACVNACAGMADPAAEIAAMREALAGRTVSCAACNQTAIERDEAREAARIMAKAILAREELDTEGILFAGERLLHRVKETHKEALAKAKEVLT